MTNARKNPLAEDLAPGLTCELLVAFLAGQTALRVPAGGWRLVQPTLEALARHPPEDWSVQLGEPPGIQGLSFAGVGGAGLVRPIILTTLAALYKGIEAGVPVHRQSLEQLVASFGEKFGLPTAISSELSAFLGTWSERLGWDYVMFTFTPGQRLERRPMGLDEGQETRREAYRLYDTFLFEPAAELLYKGQALDITRDSYPYDILILLMQRAGETWEVKNLQQRLADVHLLFRGEAAGQEEQGTRVERIRGQWNTLVTNLRGYLGARERVVVSSGGRLGLSSQVSSCLVLASDSRFLSWR